MILNSNNKNNTLKKDNIFFVYYFLKTTGFSNNMNYLLLKHKYNNKFNCIKLTKTTNSISTKLFITKSGFKFYKNSAILTGFYRAVW
jgi:hypothetical protein